MMMGEAIDVEGTLMIRRMEYGDITPNFALNNRKSL